MMSVKQSKLQLELFIYFPQNTTKKPLPQFFVTLIVNISWNHQPENMDMDEAASEANAEVP